MINNKILIFTFIVALLLTFAGKAQSSMITVNWSGTIERTFIAGTVEIGDIITGRFSYDDSVRMTLASGFRTGHDSSFSINGLSGYTTNNDVFVFNDHATVGDQFDSRAPSGGFPPITSSYIGDLLGGISVVDIFVRFNDSTATAFDDVSLPSRLDPADFDNGQRSFLRGTTGGGPLGSILFFQVDTFSFSSPTVSVTEPSTILLFAPAFAIGFLRRKVRRQYK